MKEKQQKIMLNISLLNDGIDFNIKESYIKNFNPKHVIQIENHDSAFFYYESNPTKYSDWIENFSNKIYHIDLKKIFKKNESNGLVLFYLVNNRIFVLKWGVLARHIVFLNQIDKYFGLYIANKLLTLQNSALKSAQSRIQEENPINKNWQYGEKILGQDLFSSLQDNEVIKELNIENSDIQYFSRMIGKHYSLNFQFSINISNLPCFNSIYDRLNKILEVYQTITEEDTRQLFKGLLPITKIEEINNLHGEMLKVLKTGEFYLFEPDINFDSSSLSKVKFTHGENSKEFDDLLLCNYFETNSDPSIDDLLSDNITLLDEDGKSLKNWKIIDCIYGEMEFNSTNYILSDGIWYNITKEKYQRIKDSVDSIIVNEINITEKMVESLNKKLSECDKDKPDKERMFNDVLANQIKGKCLDEIKYQIKIYEDKFEVCDIIIPEEKTFFHTKLNYGASALSHLFNQGFVSASSYKKFTKEFVTEVNKHLNGIKLDSNPDNALIHYLIINDKKIDRLTFFSKMVLENKIRDMQAMNFQVKLSFVKSPFNVSTNCE